MRDSDRLCAATMLSFDPVGFDMYMPLVNGASMVIAADEEIRDPAKLLALMARERITWLQTTPALLRMLLTADCGRSLRDLRLLVGGGALPLDLVREAFARGCELWNGYGPTETTIASTTWKVPARFREIAIGKPIAGTAVYVLDDERQLVAPGREGEIWIAGGGVAEGYVGEADLTAERFVPDPFAGGGTMYRTGDLGRIEAGLLYFHGRIDDQTKLRGHRIEPGEIESVARSVSGVRNAAVRVHELGPDDARLVLYAVGDGERAVAPLKQALARELPDYMLPQHILWLDRLPLTPNGKLDRRALPAPRGAQRADEPSAPRSESETLTVAVFNKIFGRSDIGIFDDFFDLGGHSLLAVRLMARLRASAKVDLPLRNLFEHPTPGGLAATIDAMKWATHEKPYPGSRGKGAEREEFEL